MTDITELAQMKGQKVEAPYYLAECTECGKMYPSSQLIESRNYMDGDADCYCPHCNATDPDIADCGSEGVTAWNYQQARIDALVEALEKAQAVMNAVVTAAAIRGVRPFDGIDCDPPTLEENAEACGDAMSARIRELEANPPKPHHNGLMQISNELASAKQRIAELESRTVKLPAELYTIGELIRTQDNRITDQPMFVVFQKREIIGSDEHSPSRICWVWDGEEVSELRAKRLEALYQDGRDTRGYDRYAMQEVDEFVTACFTEHGCKDYLRQNGHNLRLPYIYAYGSFRNNEYQLVRNWLAGIKVEDE